MRGYFVAYRWELWLIVGVPVTTGIVQFVVVRIVFLLSSTIESTDFYIFVHSPIVLLLLAGSYLRVRYIGREFLAVLWRYLVAGSVVHAIASVVLFLHEIVFPREDATAFFVRQISVSGLVFLVDILVLLWFARRASRLSLMHAAFLLIFASLSVIGSVTGSRVSGGNYFPYLVNLLAGGAIGLAVVLAKVWLLGNFDRRGPRFHRNAVIGLLATVILGGYAKVLIADLVGIAEGPYLAVLPWLDVVFGLAAFAVTTVFELAMLLALWGLVYLVRVRPPKADAEPESEGSPAVPGEEH